MTKENFLRYPLLKKIYVIFKKNNIKSIIAQYKKCVRIVLDKAYNILRFL